MTEHERADLPVMWGRRGALRGGTWNNLRVSNRNRNTPDNWNNNIGFRCALSLLWDDFPTRMRCIHGYSVCVLEVSAGDSRLA
jgi:hypothetical protein